MTSTATPGLRHSTVRGVAWTAAAQLTAQALVLATTVALGRLLTPTDFGLFGMVVAFTGFLLLLSDAGVGAALVQRPMIERRHVDTAFTLALVVSLVLLAATPLLGIALASFYDRDALRSLTPVLGLGFVAVGIGSTPRGLAARDMRFDVLAVADVSGALFGGALAIAAAAAGWDYWSLAVQPVATASLATVIVIARLRFRPSLRFDRGAAGELWRFGSGLSGFAAINYWGRNADNVLIGRFVGTAQLGLYALAYQVMRLPVGQITQVVGRVMFPALSRIQHDRHRVRRAYLDAIAAIAFIAFPIIAVVAAVASTAVPIVLGDDWSEAVPLLRILAVAGALQSVGSTVGWVYQSQGRTDLLWRWGVGATALTLVSFAIGLNWGAAGVAVAYAIQSAPLGYLSFRSAGRLIDLRVADVGRVLAFPVFGAAVIVGVVAAVELVWSGGTGVARLAVESAAGVIAYAAAAAIVRPAGLAVARDVLRQRATRS